MLVVVVRDGVIGEVVAGDSDRATAVIEDSEGIVRNVRGFAPFSLDFGVDVLGMGFSSGDDSESSETRLGVLRPVLIGVIFLNLSGLVRLGGLLPRGLRFREPDRASEYSLSLA